MFGYKRDFAFIFSIAAAVLTTVIICICAASCSGEKLDFKTAYYFICYRIADNSVSAGSISDTVASYGGAGYVLYHENNYYVTVSCYYAENEAKSVCAGLKKREFDCFVLEKKTESYKLKSSYAKKNAELYKGNLNTLNSLSRLAYDCANGLDTGLYGQSEAKEILGEIKKGIYGLCGFNTDNCFTRPLNELKDICEEKSGGYVYAKNMRYLQIAIADRVICAELY